MRTIRRGRVGLYRKLGTACAPRPLIRSEFNFGDHALRPSHGFLTTALPRQQGGGAPERPLVTTVYLPYCEKEVSSLILWKTVFLSREKTTPDGRV